MKHRGDLEEEEVSSLLMKMKFLKQQFLRGGKQLACSVLIWLHFCMYFRVQPLGAYKEAPSTSPSEIRMRKSRSFQSEYSIQHWNLCIILTSEPRILLLDLNHLLIRVPAIGIYIQRRYLQTQTSLALLLERLDGLNNTLAHFTQPLALFVAHFLLKENE